MNLITGEARSFVSRADQSYDLIQIGLLDSFGAAGAGVQSLNESYIYTVEAMDQYLAHTTPGGMIAITRWLKLPPRDSLKLLATAAVALRQRGIADPGDHIAMIRSWNTTTLLIRNGAFADSEIESLRSFAVHRSLDSVWLPGMRRAEANRFNVLTDAYFYEGAAALLGAEGAVYMDNYKFNIEPATDDRPYFFHFFKWATLPEVYALRHVGGAGFIEWGYLVLVATLVQAVIAGLVLIVLPLSVARREWPRRAGLRMGTYFLLLGFAFLFVEMAFIQKFILFLGHPLYSVAVVLTGFLLFAGIGSAWSDRIAASFDRRAANPIAVCTALICVIALAYAFLLPPVLGYFAGLPEFTRVLLTDALIAPLGIAMGMPFPLGLRRVADRAPAFIPWAWGINGFASVMSAVLATLLAIEFGFTAVILLALLLYAAAGIIRPN